ncbi:MAG: prepilin peptidase [Acidobacteriaceae bacterium]|nr:prepilin peptidase [Acidobacteriaceae bacterium]
MNIEVFFSCVVFIAGLAMGSFLNVCIHRMPRGLSVVSPGSGCPKCGIRIRAYDNIPVLSWLMLGGRCRDCKARISPRYIAIELLTAALFLGTYQVFGFHLESLKFCLFGFFILGLIFTDAETKLLPDALTLPGLAIGIAFSIFVPVHGLAARFFPAESLPVASEISWRVLSFMDAVLGAAVGASFIYGAGEIYKRARGVEGMGFGDVKLMAMVGAFLGVKLTVLTIFAASLAGSLCGISTVFMVWLKRTRRRMVRMHESSAAARTRAWQSAKLVYRYYQMPFGVFLGSMAIFATFLGDKLIRWYLGFYK